MPPQTLEQARIQLARMTDSLVDTVREELFGGADTNEVARFLKGLETGAPVPISAEKLATVAETHNDWVNQRNHVRWLEERAARGEKV